MEQVETLKAAGELRCTRIKARRPVTVSRTGLELNPCASANEVRKRLAGFNSADQSRPPNPAEVAILATTLLRTHAQPPLCIASKA
jgi:hypothetical protein